MKLLMCIAASATAINALAINSRPLLSAGSFLSGNQSLFPRASPYPIDPVTRPFKWENCIDKPENQKIFVDTDSIKITPDPPVFGKKTHVRLRVKSIIPINPQRPGGLGPFPVSVTIIGTNAGPDLLWTPVRPGLQDIDICNRLGQEDITLQCPIPATDGWEDDRWETIEFDYTPKLNPHGALHDAMLKRTHQFTWEIRLWGAGMTFMCYKGTYNPPYPF